MRSAGFDVKIHCDIEKTGFCFGGMGESKEAKDAMFLMRNFIRGEHPSE